MLAHFAPFFKCLQESVARELVYDTRGVVKVLLLECVPLEDLLGKFTLHLQMVLRLVEGNSKLLLRGAVALTPGDLGN